MLSHPLWTRGKKKWNKNEEDGGVTRGLCDAVYSDTRHVPHFPTRRVSSPFPHIQHFLYRIVIIIFFFSWIFTWPMEMILENCLINFIPFLAKSSRRNIEIIILAWKLSLFTSDPELPRTLKTLQDYSNWYSTHPSLWIFKNPRVGDNYTKIWRTSLIWEEKALLPALVSLCQGKFTVDWYPMMVTKTRNFHDWNKEMEGEKKKKASLKMFEKIRKKKTNISMLTQRAWGNKRLGIQHWSWKKSLWKLSSIWSNASFLFTLLLSHSSRN